MYWEKAQKKEGVFQKKTKAKKGSEYTEIEKKAKGERRKYVLR